MKFGTWLRRLLGTSIPEPPQGLWAGAFVQSSQKQQDDFALSLDFPRATFLGLCPVSPTGPVTLLFRRGPSSYDADLSSSRIVVGFAEGAVLKSMSLYSCSYKAAPGGGAGWLVFGGTLELCDNSEVLVSFKALHFYGLEIPFGSKETAGAKTDNAVIDPQNPGAGEGSLARQFRLRPKGFLDSAGGSLESQGFFGLEGAYAPPDPPPATWAAIALPITMGKLGELAESVELSAEIALGWSPDLPSAFAAIKLPGPDLLAKIGLQGIVGIKPAEASLQRLEGKWALWLRGLRPSIFGLGLPPGGHAEARLQGDDSPAGGPPSWYCAYGSTPKSPQTPSRAAPGT